MSERGMKSHSKGIGRLHKDSAFHLMSSRNTHDDNPEINAFLSGGVPPEGGTMLKTCKIDAAMINSPFSAMVRPGQTLRSTISDER